MKPLKIIIILSLLALSNIAIAQEMRGLPENASETVKKFAPIFDFDNDCCLPAPAISSNGKKNGGLNTTGSETGRCRNTTQFNNANTYARRHFVEKGGHKYEFILYALYFEKDQIVPGGAGVVGGVVGGAVGAATAGPLGAAAGAAAGATVASESPLDGHRHDWEWAAVWLKDGRITHASYSAHGKDGDTKSINDLQRSGNKVKIVYHKEEPFTRCMRFAKSGEAPENPIGRWVTPKIVEWDKLSGKQRQLLASNWGSAHAPFSNKNFFVQLYNYLPQNKKIRNSGYPGIEDWIKSNNNTLLSGDQLYVGESSTLSISNQGQCKATRIYSENQQYYLTPVESGNLVVYKANNNSRHWALGVRNSKAGDLVMRADGQLALQNSEESYWYSGTSWWFDSKYRQDRNKSVKLVLENNGSLSMYNKDGGQVWRNDGSRTYSNSSSSCGDDEGGDLFSYPLLYNTKLESITVWSGNRIDGIEFKYKTNSGKTKKIHIGGKGGRKNRTITLRNKTITGMNVRCGSRVDQLQFLYSDGSESGTYGGRGGSAKSIKIPTGKKFGGFYGRAGASIDKLGFMYTN